MTTPATTIRIASVDDLDRAAQEFINAIGDRRAIAFHGSMGAGKTTFIKALCRQMGVEDNVTSPTFAIVNEYWAATIDEPVYHFDFYRLRTAAEAADIGLDDYLASGHYCLMEWPELVADLLPDDTLNVSIEEQSDGSRLVSIMLN